MKTVLWMAIGLSFCVVLNACRPATPDSRKNAKALLLEMTLEEKAAQMTQLTIEMISNDSGGILIEPHEVDTSKLSLIIGKMNIGSILNVGGHTYTREHWSEIHAAIKKYTAQSRLKIPVLYGIDAIHGANYTGGSTLYPQQINLAATWDMQGVEQMAVNTAKVVRSSGINWNFSPVLDLGRNPRWPRFWETFGEDPYLASQLGVSMVNGYQQGDSLAAKGVAACLKHYVGYGDPRTGHDRTPAYIPERQLRELYLPPFRAAIEAGAKTIMVNSGEVNGEPVHASQFLLTHILRDELQFKGVAVTDWEDIKNLYTRHHIAANYKEAIALAINAGIDMAMVPLDLDFTRLLIENVNEGKISQKRIDESVLRILTLKYELGLFNDQPAAAIPNEKENYSLAYKLALESMVLLKNEQQTLPLKTGETILVAGPNANYINALNGGWSHTWQGREQKWNNSVITPLQALQQQSQLKILSCSEPDNTTQFTSLAARADKIVLCLGEDTYTEKPGDITSLNLPEDQLKLIQLAHKAGKPLVLVMIGGRPRTLPDCIDQIHAFVWAGLPGDAGGEALAALLTGKSDFEGRLPFTYPRYPDFHHTYDHKYTESLNNDFKEGGFNPLFELGSGLRYEPVMIENMQLLKRQLIQKDTLNVVVRVSNPWPVAKREILIVYVKDKVASITPPVKRIRAFESILLNAKETREVQIRIPVNRLSFVGVQNQWLLEPGTFEVFTENKRDTFNLVQ